MIRSSIWTEFVKFFFLFLFLFHILFESSVGCRRRRHRRLSEKEKRIWNSRIVIFPFFSDLSRTDRFIRLCIHRQTRKCEREQKRKENWEFTRRRRRRKNSRHTSIACTPLFSFSLSLSFSFILIRIKTRQYYSIVTSSCSSSFVNVICENNRQKHSWRWRSKHQNDFRS